MRIYLDACSLSRLTDDQRQTRVYAEAEAIEQVIRLVSEDRIVWIASTILTSELLRNPDHDRRKDAVALLAHAGELTSPSPLAIERAEFLATLGYGTFDALHLACAEEGLADALLTTDDRFIRQAARKLGDPRVVVINPLDWLKEMRRWCPPSK